MAGDPKWRQEYVEKAVIGRLQGSTWLRTAHEQLEPLVRAANVPQALKDSFARERPAGCAIDDLLDLGVPEYEAMTVGEMRALLEGLRRSGIAQEVGGRLFGTAPVTKHPPGALMRYAEQFLTSWPTGDRERIVAQLKRDPDYNEADAEDE